MTEKLLERLSRKLTEVYDLELAEELTDLFVELTEEIKEDDYKYFELVRKHAELEVRYEKLEKEKDLLEYDKNYFANEVLENE